MVAVLGIIIKAIYSCKQWINNTFVSGWENLSNQITYLLSLLDTGGGLTTFDKQIKPLEIADILTTQYCDVNAIDYATQTMAHTLSWKNDYQNIYLPGTNYTTTIPKIYFNGAAITTAIDNFIPRDYYWTLFTFRKYYQNILFYCYASYYTVSMCIFNNKLYFSIYDLVYILDMVNYEIEEVRRAVLPIQYFFTDGTHLYYSSYPINTTPYDNMIVKVI